MKRGLPLAVAAGVVVGAAALDADADDAYGSFAELAAAETEGEDFRIEARPGETGVLVLAPHGGGIEPGTGELARAVAGDDHALYVFAGTKPRGNRVLHVTSTRFDEPRCLELLAGADRVVALHGCRGDEPAVQLGGRDAALARRVGAALTGAGFAVVPAEGGLAGRSPRNVVNRGRTGAGVQLELTRALRDACFEDRGRTRRTGTFERFVAALRAALEDE